MYLIMLDLDHTLIHSEEYELVSKAIAHKNRRDKNAKKGDIANGGVVSEKTKEKYESIIKAMETLEHYNMDNEFIVFLRPHVREFLDHVTRNHRYGVWTAADKHYATSILNFLNLTHPQYLLFNIHCNYSSRIVPPGNPKNIHHFKTLFAEELKVILFDDDERVYKDQQEYVHNIVPFYYSNTDDRVLLDLIQIL